MCIRDRHIGVFEQVLRLGHMLPVPRQIADCLLVAAEGQPLIETGIELAPEFAQRPTPVSYTHLKKDNPSVRPLNNAKAVEYKTEHDRDLVREYRAYVDMNFQPMSAEEAARRMG